MPKPIQCARCARPFNASFRRCPFCNMPVDGNDTATPPPPTNELVACRGCKRNFNARLGRCPFCNASREITPVTAPPATPAVPAAPPPANPAGPDPRQPAPSPTPSTTPARAGTFMDYSAVAEQTMATHQMMVPLEFHPAAVVALDAFFDLTWGAAGVARGNDEWRPSTAQRSAIIALGAFFGELLRRQFGGEWQDDPSQPDNPLAARVVLPGGIQVYALSKAFRRMQNGAEDPFEQLHRWLREQVARLNPAATSPPGATELAGWLRQAAFFQRATRGDLALGFLRRASALDLDDHARADLVRRIQELEAAEARTATVATTATTGETASAAVTGDGGAGRTRHATAPPVKATATAPPIASPAPVAPPAPPAAPAAEDPIPDVARAHCERATRMAAQGRAADALGQFERALALAPAYVEAVLGIAAALLALGRAREAREWAEHVAIGERFGSARDLILGRAAEAVGDPVAARAAFVRASGAEQLTAAERRLASERAAALAIDEQVLIAEVVRLESTDQQLAALERINAAHPTLAEPWRERGVALSQIGRADEAFECLERAIIAAPGEDKSYDHLAVVLARLKRFEEAIAVVERGLRHCPGSATLLARKGVMLTYAGRFDEAVACLEESLRVTPDDARTWAWKGDAEQKLGHLDASKRSLDRSLACTPRADRRLTDIVRRQRWSMDHPGRSRSPELAEQLQQRAFAEVGAGRLDAAIALYDEAVAAEPLSGELWQNRAAALAHQGRTEEALVSYRKADELLPLASPRVEEEIVRCLLVLDRGDEALAMWDRFLGRGPFRTDAMLGKARTLVRLGRAADALPLYLKLAARTPDNAWLCLERAEVLGAASQESAAAHSFRTAIRLAPDDEALQSRARQGLSAIGVR